MCASSDVWNTICAWLTFPGIFGCKHLPLLVGDFKTRRTSLIQWPIFLMPTSAVQERKQAMRAQQWEEIAPDVTETVELPGVLKEMQATGDHHSYLSVIISMGEHGS